MASEPPADVMASIITQVSPTGQPARAPARPVKRPAKAKPKSTSASKVSAAPVAGTEKAAAETDTTLPEPLPLPVQDGETATTAGDSGFASLPATAQSSTIKSSDTPAVTATSSSSLGQSSQSKEALATPQRQSASSPVGRKKKKKSAWTSLLIALGCASKSAQSKNYEDTSNPKPTETKPPQKLTKRSSDPSKNAEMQQVSSAPVSAAILSNDGMPPHASTSALGISNVSPEIQANTSPLGAQLSHEETGDVLSGAVVPPGAEGTPTGTPRKKRSRDISGMTAGSQTPSMDASSDEEGDEEDDGDEFLDDQDEEERIIQAGGMGIPVDEDGNERPLLSEIGPHDSGRKCLVLDLDETLVHSSFKMIHSADYIVPVEIENTNHNVYVIKRPGVDEFLRRMGEIYEVVIFTASLSKYADPVLDQLDVHRVVRHRLFRESCYNHRGNYVKDLSQLGRPISETIIIDNSPASYIFHPKNAVPVSSWFNDPHDTELTDMIGVLADLAEVDDVRSVLDGALFS